MARLEFANALRGLAALSVAIAHYNSFFFGSASLIATMANTPPLVRETSPALGFCILLLSYRPIASVSAGRER